MVDAHPEWFKQRSPQWRNLCTQAHITWSTAYNAMGFRGFSQLCNHFREFVYKKQPAPVDNATQCNCNMEFNMRLVTSVPNAHSL